MRLYSPLAFCFLQMFLQTSRLAQVQIRVFFVPKYTLHPFYIFRMRHYLFLFLTGVIFMSGNFWWTFLNTISLSCVVIFLCFASFLAYATADTALPFVFNGNFFLRGNPNVADFILRLDATLIVDIFTPPKTASLSHIYYENHYGELYLS